LSNKIDVDSDNLKDGLLGLIVALVEIIRDALKLQAMRRMESGRLTDAQVDKLGTALLELEEGIEEIKQDQGLAETVESTRKGLNEVVDEVLNPERWVDHMEGND